MLPSLVARLKKSSSEKITFVNKLYNLAKEILLLNPTSVMHMAVCDKAHNMLVSVRKD